MSEWKQDGCVAIWLRVPILASSLIPIAASEGFEFHHAEGDYSVLCQWLQTDTHSRLPPFATHQVGVAGKTSGAHYLTSNETVCQTFHVTNTVINICLLTPKQLFTFTTINMYHYNYALYRSICRITFLTVTNFFWSQVFSSNAGIVLL